MIPVAFDYHVASSVDEACGLLGDGGEATKLIAGGQSLLPLMRLRLTRPRLLVDIGRLEELSYIRESGDRIVIGALTRHHDLEHSGLLRRECPLLGYVAGLVGDPQIRHRGTIGGAVAHADPASDLPSALLALEAEFVVRRGPNERTVAATAFFTGLFETALRPGELLTEIRVPRLDGTRQGWSYQKFRRRAQDWAIVGVAAVLDRENGSINRAAIALTNMGPTPLRASTVERALSGAGAVAVGAASERAGEEGDPSSDVNGSATYRRHLARVLVRRAVEEALSR